MANRAVGELRQVAATPDQVHAAARMLRETWTEGEITPQALAKHWPRLAAIAKRHIEVTQRKQDRDDVTTGIRRARAPDPRPEFGEFDGDVVEAVSGEILGVIGRVV